MRSGKYSLVVRCSKAQGGYDSRVRGNRHMFMFFLGVKVTQTDDGIIIFQKYVKNILNKFKKFDSNPISTPMKERLQLTREGYKRKVESNML